MLIAELLGYEATLKFLNKYSAGYKGVVRSQAIAWSLMVEVAIKRGKLSGQVLKRKTGALAASIFTRVAETKSGDKTAWLITIGSNSPYAKAHEEGMVIKKKGKMLAIPFPGVKGVPGDFPRSEKLVHDGIIWQLTSSKNALKRPLFSLHDKVQVKKRPFITPAVLEKFPLLPPMIDKAVDDFITMHDPG